MSKTAQTKHDAISAIIRQASPRQLQEHINTFHPSDVAEVFMMLEDSEREFVIMALNFHQLADLFAHLEPTVAAKHATLLSADKAAHVFETLPPDDAAHILHVMSKASQAAIYEHLDPKQAESLQSLTTYKSHTAGALMTSDCVTLAGDTTAADTLKLIAKDTNPIETIHRIYVTGENRFLEGVVELRALIEAEPKSFLKDLMHADILTVQVEDRVEYVIRLIQNYQLYQLPVVDAQFRLLGVITMDDAVSVLWRQSRRTYAMQGGLSSKMPLGVTLGRRLVWMGLLAGLAFLLSLTVDAFNLTQPTLISLLIVWPLILGLTGQMVFQTQAITIQSLQSQRLPEARSKVLHILKESALNALSGIIFSLFLVGALALVVMSLTFEPLSTAFIILAGLTLLLGSLLAGIMGSVIPILLHRLNIRPIWASGLLLRALQDIMLTAGLLWAASLWL